MAFWNNNKNDEMDELIKICKSQKNIQYEPIITYLEKIKNNPEENFFGSYEMLKDFIYEIVKIITDGKELEFDKYLSDAKDTYSFMLPFGDKTNNKEQLDNLFLNLYSNNGIISKIGFVKEIYALFESKEDYYEILNMITKIPNYNEKLSAIYNFMIKVKKYYVLENNYKAAIIDFLNSCWVVPDIEKLSKDRLEIASKMAGVYDINEKTLAKIDRKINGANSTIAKLNNLLEMVPSQLKLLDEALKTSTIKIEESTNEQITLLKHEATMILTNIKSEYQNLWQLISRDATMKKDEIISELMLSLEEQIKRLEELSVKIASKTTIELERVRNEGSRAVSRLDEYVKNNPELLKVAESMQGSKEFMDNLAKISSEMQTRGVTVPNIVIPKLQTLNQVNYFFDDRIPFSERLQEVRRRIKVNEEKGVVYHEKMETIIRFLMEKDCPYLYGPSGCGKTHVVQEISKLLEIPFIDIGYIIEEYDLIGYKDLYNNFSKTNFSECYEKGYIAFCDELDNGNPRAMIKLNNFTRNKQYCFPGGVIIKRHPNFRIIGAGNTSGNGANRAYNARSKLDESVKERLKEIPFDYDERIDQSLLKAYPDWLDFVLKFRSAIATYYKGQENSISGTITHRDVSDIKDYLDHQSFNQDEILYYEFIESKDDEYLTFLMKELKKIYTNNQTEGAEICKQFIKKTEEVIKNGR